MESTLSPPASASEVAPFTIADRTFRSRLILGTGKYPSFPSMVAALDASGTEVVTVALRRVNLDALGKGSLIDYVDPKRYLLLPNTAGCYTADEAVRTARHWKAGQEFAFIPKGTGVLLVPVPERAELAGIAKGAKPKDYRDRKDRV